MNQPRKPHDDPRVDAMSALEREAYLARADNAKRGRKARAQRRKVIQTRVRKGM